MIALKVIINMLGHSYENQVRDVAILFFDNKDITYLYDSKTEELSYKVDVFYIFSCLEKEGNS